MNPLMTLSKRTNRKKYVSRLWSVAALVTAVFLSLPSQAETRGYVIYYMHLATHADPRNCPEGEKRDSGAVLARALKLRGYSAEEAKKLLDGSESDFSPVLGEIERNRGFKNGKPANVANYPDSSPDPKLATVNGPYAYGFNLNGKVEESPGAFEDPETGEKGVDNQLFRAVGCADNYNFSLPKRPYSIKAFWDLFSVGSPAWLMAVTTDDFDAGGSATVTFYNAISSRRQDAASKTMRNMTYVIDPSSRTSGEFRGVIRNGVFTSEPGTGKLFMEQPNYQAIPEMDLTQARLRINFDPKTGDAGGYVAGYLPWLNFWFTGPGGGLDIVNTWYRFNELADASPDPETGKNTAISATFRLDAAPAFIARVDGQLIATTH